MNTRRVHADRMMYHEFLATLGRLRAGDPTDPSAITGPPIDAGATRGSEAALPVGGVEGSGWGRAGHPAREDFAGVRLTTVTAGPARDPF